MKRMTSRLAFLLATTAVTPALAGGGPYYITYDRVCNVDEIYYGTDFIVFGKNIAENCTPSYTVTVGNTVMYQGSDVVYSGYLDSAYQRVVFSDATSVPGQMFIVELDLVSYLYTEYVTDGTGLKVQGMGTWSLSLKPPAPATASAFSAPLPPRGAVRPVAPRPE